MKGPILPGAHSIERYLIEEHLHQILELQHFERKEWYVQEGETLEALKMIM